VSGESTMENGIYKFAVNLIKECRFKQNVKYYLQLIFAYQVIAIFTDISVCIRNIIKVNYEWADTEIPIFRAETSSR
jgi:hypothetical protein